MEPFEQGYSAYWCGLDYADCPYDSKSDEGEQWFQGWDSAYDEDCM